MTKAYQPFFATSLNRLENYIPSVVIGSSSLVLFDKYYGDRCRSKMPLSNKNNRLVSSKQANRIRYYVNLLIDCSKRKKVFSKVHNRYFSFKVNLITLTLPSVQLHTDKEIHERCFKSFIRAWKQLSPELIYIYKAEVQDNGNLHYHLTTNTYIHHRTLRNLWNLYIDKLGYVSRSGIESPNSTDVHSVKKIKSLASYMVAYFSKKDMYSQKLKRYHRRFDKKWNKTKSPFCTIPKNYFKYFKRKVELKVWDCSKVLMLSKCSVEIDSDSVMQEIRYMLQIQELKRPKDWCGVLKWDREKDIHLKELSSIYNNHISSLRNHVKDQPSLYYE